MLGGRCWGVHCFLYKPLILILVFSPHQLDQLREDLQASREEASRLRTDSDKALVSQRASWTDERAALQKRGDELDIHLNELQDKYNKAIMVNKKVRGKNIQL